MSKAIPDRWTRYKPVGEKIQGTRFIAFKVPLRSNVNEKVEKPTRLDADMLLRIIPDLGLIIDLTNTDRYYDPQYFINKGIEHRKLKIPGHVTPSGDLVKMFKRHVQEYLSGNEHNDKLIGVHCTHGVNRTGFFICNYMITEMTMNPKEAVEKFTQARGHSIERPNYLASLLALRIEKPINNIVRQQETELPSRKRSISCDNDKLKFEERWNSKSTHKRQHTQRSENNSRGVVYPPKQYCSDYRESNIPRPSAIEDRRRNNASTYYENRDRVKSFTQIHSSERAYNSHDRSHNESYNHRYSSVYREPESTRAQSTAFRSIHTSQRHDFRQRSSNSKFKWRRRSGNDSNERNIRDSRS